MNSLQVAVSMAFAGLLTLLVAYVVSLQAQLIFEEEARVAAQFLADSVANQIRSGIAAALLPEVEGYYLTVALPAFSPPFDAFYYVVRLVNEGGVLTIYVQLYAHRGSGYAHVETRHVVYRVENLQSAGRVVELRAESDGQPEAQCLAEGLVVLSKAGCRVEWYMPDPRYVKQLRFIKR